MTGFIRKTRKPLLCIAVVLGLPLAAQSIQDDADIFSAGTRSDAERILSQLKRATGVEIFVETQADLGNVPSGSYALERARERRVYGAYVFIALDARKVEVKVAGALKDVLPRDWVVEKRAIMTAAFQENDFDRGLIEFVRSAAADLEDVRVERPAVETGPRRRAQLDLAGRALMAGLAGSVLLIVLLGRLVLPLLTLLRTRSTAA